MLTVAVMADLPGLTEILSTSAADCELSDRPSTSVKISDTEILSTAAADCELSDRPSTSVKISDTEILTQVSRDRHTQMFTSTCSTHLLNQ